MKSNKIVGAVLSLFFCMSAMTIQAQTDCTDRLMTDINFKYNGGSTAPARWDISETDAPGLIFDNSAAGYKYIATGKFSDINVDYQNGNSNLNKNREYAVVENPNTLSDQYANIPTDGMLVINPKQGENDQYVVFSAGGLVGGKEYYIELKVWNVVDLAYPGPNNQCYNWCNWNNQLYIDWKSNQAGAESSNQTEKNWDGTNGSGEWQGGTNQVGNILKVSSGGSYAIISGKVKLPDNASTMTLTLAKGNSSNPVVLGIDYIKMYGCQEEAIVTSTGSKDGSKVCETSSLTLTAQGIGPAGSTYTWSETINGVTTPITGNSQSVTVTTPGGKDVEVTYTAVGKWATKSIKLTTALCCYNVGDIVEVLRYDFPLAPEACNPNRSKVVLPGKIDPYYQFACTGGVYDANGYAVIKDTRADGHFGGWTGHYIDEHTAGYTGKTGSGMLAVNAAGFEGVFFEYDLPPSAICGDGASYQFSAWYASADPANTDPCNFDFQLVEINGATETVIESTSTGDFGYNKDHINHGSNYENSGCFTRWKQTTLVFTTQPGGTYKVRLVNKSKGSAGNDVLIDDILITKCSPKIDFFPDGFPAGTEEAEVCSNTIEFKIEVPVNAATPNGDLADLFPGSPTLYYQLQFCDDYDEALGTGSWQLSGTVQTTALFNVSATDDDKWYRVKITTDPATAANTDPPSITCGVLEFYTRMFRIKLADKLDVSVASATASACVGDELGPLTGITGTTIGPAAEWGWKKGTDPENDPFLPGYGLSSDEAKKKFKITSYADTDAGDYYFYVKEDECKNWAKVTVSTKPAPSVNTISEQTICSESSFTEVTLASTPTGASFEWTVTQTGVTGATAGDGASIPSAALTLSAGQTTPGTAVYSVIATLDGCEGTATLFTVNVVSVTAAKSGTWQTTANYGETVTLTVSTADAILPTGGSFEYKWERKLSSATTFTTLATQTTATLQDIPPTSGIYDYQVTVTMKDAGGNTICAPVTLPVHQVEISSLKMCPKDTIYFCPGESATFTGCGTAANGDPLDEWIWYKKGTTPPTSGSTNSADEILNIGSLTAADSAVVWCFRGFKNGESGDQELLLLKRADYSFAVANTPVVACKDDIVTLTANATGSSVGAATIQYDWDGGGYATANTYTLSTATAGTGSITVIGKADKFCKSAAMTINYDIAERNIDRDTSNPDTWQTKVYEKESVNLVIAITGTTIPTGGKIVYKWEKSTNPAGTWTTISTATTASLTDVPAVGGNCYRATATIVDAAGATICTPWVDNVHCVDVISAKIGKDSTVYFCPGYNLVLEGKAENVDYYVWYKEGAYEPQLTDLGMLTAVTDPITGTSPGNIATTYPLPNVDDTNNGEIWYFKVFSGTKNPKKQTFKITRNANFAFTTSATKPILECKTIGGSKTITANNTNSIPNASYEWTADNGQYQAYSTINSFALSTDVATSGSIVIKGKAENLGTANNRCESSVTVSYLISQLEFQKDPATPWETSICAGTNTTFVADTSGTGKLNGAQLEIIWEHRASSSAQWNTLSGIDPLSRTVSPNEKTEYRVTARTKNGADILCTRVLPVHTLDVINVTVGDDTEYGTCVAIPLTLTGTTNGTSWQWEDVDGNPLTSVSGNIADLELTVAPTETTSYYFVGYDGICKSTKRQEHIVKVFDLKLDIGGDRSSCPGMLIPLVADTTGTNAVDNFYITWTKQPVNGISFPTVLSGSLVTQDSPTESMIYTAIANNSGCPPLAKSIQVTIFDPPAIVEVVEIGPKVVQIEAIGGTPGNGYEYTIDEQVLYTLDKVFEKVPVGHHVAYVRDENDCVGSLPFFVNNVSFDFPKFFTPNGDGVHDTWRVKNLDAFSSMDLRIFDRFGRELIHITDPEKNWDGRYQGKLLRSDDYWYVLYIEETKQTYTGHFTLISPK